MGGDLWYFRKEDLEATLRSGWYLFSGVGFPITCSCAWREVRGRRGGASGCTQATALTAPHLMRSGQGKPSWPREGPVQWEGGRITRARQGASHILIWRTQTLDSAQTRALGISLIWSGHHLLPMGGKGCTHSAHGAGQACTRALGEALGMVSTARVLSYLCRSQCGSSADCRQPRCLPLNILSPQFWKEVRSRNSAGKHLSDGRC